MTDSRQSATQHGRPSTRVLETVSEVDNTEITDLPPLYDVLDPDALDSVVQSDCSVTFDYAGYTVGIRESGEIYLQDA